MPATSAFSLSPTAAADAASPVDERMLIVKLKKERQGLEDRRAQTTALMALAMGVVSRMQESEREPEFF